MRTVAETTGARSMRWQLPVSLWSLLAIGLF